ncbi:MAG: electron transfer flavoprotein subunit alpha/FixB family protein [Chitinophagales bacterium]|nr:electron transfer flavoprotein subunit alpha/FixB family protein [Chitinophagales bacterium]
MVLVYIDHANGKIKKSSLEAATYGVQLASKMGTSACAVALGTIENISKLGEYGITKVLQCTDARFDSFDARPIAKAVSEAAISIGANVVVMSFNQNGKALGPRLSVRLKAGIIPGASSMVDVSNGFKAKKNVFSGKAIADCEILTSTKIVSISPNTIPVAIVGGTCTVDAFNPSLTDADFAIKVRGVEMVKGDIPLSEADLVVSAGRGLKGPENWGMIEECAKILGAATACSRAVADVHWRPHHEHVGQTGLAISPNLYIAVGISGAIQHLAGVSSSKTIVVINTDPEAPFFKAADYGVIGDAMEVVPKLNIALKKLKAG